MGNGDLSRSLIAYYPFDGNFNDKSGNGNNGFTSAAGGSLTTDKDSVPNAAFNCNGNGQQLIVNNNGLIQYDSAFSVSCNVLIRRLGRLHFVAMAKYSNGAGASFSVATNIPNNPNVFFNIVDRNAPCDDPNTGPQSTNQDVAFVLTHEKWYNIICTFNRGVMKVYINGNLTSTKISTTKSLRVCAGSQLLIGGWWNQDPQGSLDGKIDEVRLYKRELTTDEIAGLSSAF
jgi:hypothetical protein